MQQCQPQELHPTIRKALPLLLHLLLQGPTMMLKLLRQANQPYLAYKAPSKLLHQPRQLQGPSNPAQEMRLQRMPMAPEQGRQKL